MGLAITYLGMHEAIASRNYVTDEYVGLSAAHDTPAKVLIMGKDGNLVPCNYQSWMSADGHGVGGGIFFVPSGERSIDPQTLNVVEERSFKSQRSEGEGFHNFICHLMSNSPANVQFIRYDGVEKVTLPREYWNFFGIKIARRQRDHFIHRVSLCRLRSPLDEEYEARITERNRQIAERKSNLERLERELSPLSLNDFLNVAGQKISTFDRIPLEHSEENTISSGDSSPPIHALVSLAKERFVKKAPHRTECLVATKEHIIEIPATFWEQGMQRVTICGIALVPKQENS